MGKDMRYGRRDLPIKAYLTEYQETAETLSLQGNVYLYNQTQGRFWSQQRGLAVFKPAFPARLASNGRGSQEILAPPYHLRLFI